MRAAAGAAGVEFICFCKIQKIAATSTTYLRAVAWLGYNGFPELVEMCTLVLCVDGLPGGVCPW